jgi:hypothetical protein
MMSDLDISGPGLFAFEKARPRLHRWLKAMQAQNKSARVYGFSLGGALAAYAFIYENELLDETGSISFNAPGVSKKVIADWLLLSETRQRGLTFYVAKGDLVSKVGHLFGPVFELSIDTPVKPLTAHTLLMSGQASFVKRKVNLREENLSR